MFKKDTVISKDEARQCAIQARKAARVKSGNGCGLEGLGVTGHAGETGLNTEMKRAVMGDIPEWVPRDQSYLCLHPGQVTSPLFVTCQR